MSVSLESSDLDMIGKLLAPRISRGIQKIKKIQPGVRIKADNAEWLLSESIRQAKLGPSGWSQGTKRQEHDMWLTPSNHDKPVNISVSHKTGIFNIKKNTMQFSGYRLGRYGSLDKQVAALPSLNADLFVYIAGPREAKATDPYFLALLPGSELNYGRPEDWEPGHPSSYLRTDRLTAKIVQTLSHQLWTTVRLPDNSFIVEL